MALRFSCAPFSRIEDKVDAAKAEQAFLEAQEQLDKAVGPKRKVEANFAFKRARTLAIN
jgi:hypothetical protein